MEMGNEAEAAGLAMTAGVITSIPYHSVSADPKAPIAVDHLPAQSSARKEPQPHHLSRAGGDFHQYPAFNSSSQSTNGASHPTGPRPPPHVNNTTMAGSSTGDRGTKLQQWGRPGSSAANHNASAGNYNSYSTNDSSTNPRTSFDQASIQSSFSSATRGSSLFSSDNSSRTAIPSLSADQNTLHVKSPSSVSRFSSASHAGWQPQQAAAFSSTTSFAPDGFHLPRPSDDRVIEQQFIELMHKRGWQNLPEQAKRQMLAYAPAKKWTLVHQDKLTEWQGDQKRKQHARQTYGTQDGSLGNAGRADEEGSPEWYVKKLMDDTITTKQLQSLSVSLRTQPIR